MLGIFGGIDPTIPVAQVNAFEAALNEAGVPNQISIYEFARFENWFAAWYTKR